MRDLSDAVQAEQASDNTRPINIYEIYLGSQTVVDDDTLFFAAHSDTIKFFDTEGTPQDFLPLGLRRSTIKHNMDLTVDYFNVTYDNVDRAMSALIADTDFRSKRVILRSIFLDSYGSNDDAVILFDGIMDKPVINESALTAQVVSRLNLKIKTGRLYQLMCPWTFGGTYCAYNRTGTSSTGTIGSGSTSSILVDTSRTEVNDYWKHGIIEITSGTLSGIKRRVTGYVLASGQMSVDIVFDSVPLTGVTYDIYRGCDKTISWCKDMLSNQLNFGGFHTLPVKLPEGE